MKKNRGQAKPAPSTAARPNPKPQNAWLRPGAWMAAAIASVAYLPTLSNGFVNWDDEATILNNPNLRSPTAAASGIFSTSCKALRDWAITTP